MRPHLLPYCLAAVLLAASVGLPASAQNKDDERYLHLQPARPPAGSPPPRERPRREEPPPRAYPQQQAAPRPAPSPPAAQAQPGFFGNLFGFRRADPPAAAPPPVEARSPAEARRLLPPEPADSYGGRSPERALRELPERAARELPERAYREPSERDVDRRRVVARPVPAVRVPKVAVAKPKAVEPTTHVVMFGDSLAERVKDGLSEAYEDAVEVEVVDRTRPDSGLVRTDHHDWAKTVAAYLGGNPKITVAVMMLGVNDRQAIREGDATHEFLSDRWREIYRERVDAVIKVFAERRVPLVWVGAPPMRNENTSADVVALNEIFRERVQRTDATYVDIWPGFVDDANRYTVVGPDTGGQTARLRASDGVHFTSAGARKAAFFVETELKRLIGRKDGTAVAALPAPGDAPSVMPPPVASPGTDAIDRMISASLPALPEPSGLLPLAARPSAGPVVPLTKPDLSPGGALMGTRPRFDGDAAFVVDQALRNGVAPAPKPGRADDFSWPRS